MLALWFVRHTFIGKEFNSYRIYLGHQHGHRFIVLGHQYGRRDVMWKHSILKEVKPSPNSKMIKLLTFDNLFPPLRHNRQNSTAITFSRRNDAGYSWAVLSTQYWENLVLVVFLVSESKPLQWQCWTKQVLNLLVILNVRKELNSFQFKPEGGIYWGGRGGGGGGWLLIGIFLFCLQISGPTTREGLLSGSLR